MIHLLTEVLLNNLHLNDINPILCGREKCAPNHTYGPATRDYFLLHYVVSGCGVLHNQRGSHSVQKGQIFVICPQEKTLYTADEKTPWDYYWIGFESNLPMKQYLFADVIDAPFCQNIFVDSLQYKPSVGHELFISGKLFSLFAQLEQLKAPQQVQASAQYVQLAITYIEYNYMNKISVASIADNLGLDRSYFSNIFKEHIGRSPQQYIVEFRLNKAASLIADNGFSPGDAAREVGYQDIYLFSKMFRKKMGVPPSKYRR